MLNNADWITRDKKYKDGSKDSRPSWRWTFTDTSIPQCGEFYIFISFCDPFTICTIVNIYSDFNKEQVHYMILDASSGGRLTGSFIRTIGLDSDCANKDDFCNGALKANTEYT